MNGNVRFFVFVSMKTKNFMEVHMGFHSNFHNIADKEFARRISIGFNDWLSLEERRVLIARDSPLQELSRTIKGFRSYEKEARGILKWLDDPFGLHHILW